MNVLVFSRASQYSDSVLRSGLYFYCSEEQTTPNYQVTIPSGYNSAKQQYWGYATKRSQLQPTPYELRNVETGFGFRTEKVWLRMISLVHQKAHKNSIVAE
jgi:hypothetical protein